MLWKVDGADASSGEEKSLTIEAPSRGIAEAAARQHGLLIAEIDIDSASDSGSFAGIAAPVPAPRRVVRWAAPTPPLRINPAARGKQTATTLPKPTPAHSPKPEAAASAGTQNTKVEHSALIAGNADSTAPIVASAHKAEPVLPAGSPRAVANQPITPISPRGVIVPACSSPGPALPSISAVAAPMEPASLVAEPVADNDSPPASASHAPRPGAAALALALAALEPGNSAAPEPPNNQSLAPPHPRPAPADDVPPWPLVPQATHGDGQSLTWASHATGELQPAATVSLQAGPRRGLQRFPMPRAALLLMAAALIPLYGLWLRPAALNAPRWEYRVESPRDADFDETMERLGAGGWELVTARRAAANADAVAHASYEMIFKRQIPAGK